MEEYKITKPIRLIELFAGIGTQAMAFRDLNAEFERWKTCEWDYHAILSYAAIHCADDINDYSRGLDDYDVSMYLFCKGISSDGKKPMSYEQVKRLPKGKKRRIYNAIFATVNLVNIETIKADDLEIVDTDRYCYVMTYSFPCQDISIAGKSGGMEKGSGTRSSLLWEVERILLELRERNEQPQVLLMENVPEVIRTKNYQHFMKWYKSLEGMGYQSYYKLLNAKDYGVPQSRNRCFMISVLGDYDYDFPAPVELTKCLRDVLEPVVNEKYYLPDERAKELLHKGNIKTEDDIANTVRTSGRGSTERHAWDLVAVKQIGNCMPTATRDNPNQGRVYATEGLSPSLNCMEGGNRQPFILVRHQADNTLLCDGDNGVVDVHRIRRLTPLECWRLMGFSDEDFYKAQAVNSNTQLYKQAGNSVVKQVLMALINTMLM